MSDSLQRSQIRANTVFATMGRTAAGKTELAQFLSGRLGLVYIPEAAFKRILRKNYSTQDCLDEQLRDIAYCASIAAAEASLLRGLTPIIDASFHRSFRRNWLFEAAERAAAKVCILYCVCPSIVETRRRIDLRRHSQRTFQTHADSMHVYSFIDEAFDEPTHLELEARNCSACLMRIDTFQNKVDFFSQLPTLSDDRSLEDDLQDYFALHAMPAAFDKEV